MVGLTWAPAAASSKPPDSGTPPFLPALGKLASWGTRCVAFLPACSSESGRFPAHEAVSIGPRPTVDSRPSTATAPADSDRGRDMGEEREGKRKRVAACRWMVAAGQLLFRLRAGGWGEGCVRVRVDVLTGGVYE